MYLGMVFNHHHTYKIVEICIYRFYNIHKILIKDKIGKLLAVRMIEIEPQRNSKTLSAHHCSFLPSLYNSGFYTHHKRNPLKGHFIAGLCYFQSLLNLVILVN